MTVADSGACVTGTVTGAYVPETETEACVTGTESGACVPGTQTEDSGASLTMQMVSWSYKRLFMMLTKPVGECGVNASA